nr:EAL domain-containing protein [Actinomycetota bacterium]
FEHAVVVADLNGRLVHVNREAAESLMDLAGEEDGRDGWIRHVACDPPLFSSDFLEMLAAGDAVRLTGKVERPGRVAVPVEISARMLCLAHSSPNAALLVFEDVSRLKEIEGFAHHVTLYDGITGLPNLSLAAGRLGQALRRHAPDSVGLLAIQVSRFKQIRAALGPNIADEIVQELAARLVSSTRPGEMAARLDTDDFALIVLGIESEHDLERRIARVAERLRRPILTTGGEVFASFRIGSARGTEGSSADDLLSRASARARSGDGAPAHDHLEAEPLDFDRISASIDLEMALHRAVLNREFIPHFQPQVSLADRAVLGAEVLVRWQRARKGLVSPAEFLPTAESVGIVTDIGRMMLEQACEVLAEWGSRGLDWTLSVNVSGHQLLQPGFPGLVAEMLAASSFEPGRLTLEVTETALMADLEVATARMRRLRDLGVGLAIDDFGTGYSSLTYLRKLPFTEMKLDRSFISGLGSDAGDEAIVSSVVTLGQTFGIRTVAEGVETELQYSRLLAMGCDAAQGYLFGKPMPLDELSTRFAGRAQA